jgi:hypothetical protein
MKDLVKNPLGIIALFISLIYAFANLLLGATATSLDHDERFPLIAFIVLFPIVVLGVFYLLVTRHHGKLYAPGDYKDDKSFLRTLTQEERELKLAKEVQEVQYAQQEQEAVPTPAGEATEKVTPQTNTQSTSQAPEKFSDIRSELQLVESLVVSKFESEFKQRAERDVGVGGTSVNFDALFHTGGKLTFLEVKMVRHLNAFNMMLDRILYNAVIADRALNSNFKLVVAIVHTFSSQDTARLESVWSRRTEGCPASVELRLIGREELGG